MRKWNAYQHFFLWSSEGAWAHGTHAKKGEIQNIQSFEKQRKLVKFKKNNGAYAIMEHTSKKFLWAVKHLREGAWPTYVKRGDIYTKYKEL